MKKIGMVTLFLALVGTLVVPVGAAVGASAPDTPVISVVKVKDVMSGFAFRDNLGRAYKLLAVKAYRIDTAAERLSYDSAMKSILTTWLTSGDTVSILSDGRRGADGLIPALVFVGERLNCSLEYAWRDIAVLDTAVPAWFDLKVFLEDAQNPPSYVTGDEPNPEDNGALSMYIMHRGRVLYSGFVYPAPAEE